MKKKSRTPTEMTPLQKRKYDGQIQKIKNLLKKWNDIGVEIFQELQKIEKEGLWKIEYQSFGDFLTSKFPNEVGFKHYDNVTKAMDSYGTEFIKKVPIEVCHAIMNPQIVRNKYKKDKLVSIITNYSISNEGSVPKKDFIQKQIREHIIPEYNKPHKTTRVFSDLDRVTKERDALLVKCRKLESEVRKITKERDELKKQLEKVKPLKRVIHASN